MNGDESDAARFAAFGATPCRRWYRLGPPLAVVGALAFVAAACGSGSASRGVASLGTPTTVAPAAASSASSAGSSVSGQRGAQAVKFAACMRSHGVKDFPSPIISGNQVSIRISPALSPKSPRFQSALAGCRSLLPGGPLKGGGITPADQVDYLKAAQCMRSHGIAGFPDPTFSNGGVRFELPSGMNANAMPFLKARVICEKLIPAGLPYSS